MMMLTVSRVVMMAVSAVSAAFGLEGSPHSYKIRSESTEHILDHVVGPDTKNLMSHFSWQVTISQMPSKTHELIGIFVPDFDNKLHSGLNLEPPPILELQAVSVGHRNRLRKIEQDIFALIRGETNAAAMARVKVKGESTRRLFLRPLSGRAMN